MDHEVEVGSTKTFTVSGPETFLLRAYGERIDEIHQKIEDAIRHGSLETELGGGGKYLELGVRIDDELFPMFECMYVTEGGWADLVHYETTRLYYSR